MVQLQIQQEFESKKSEIPSRYRPRILIVEDDVSQLPIWRQVIADVTKDAYVNWVPTEEAAERSIRSGIAVGDRFDVIIADIFLAGKRTGLDLWRRYGRSGCNFVLVSASFQCEIQKMPLIEAPPTFIQKPLPQQRCKDILADLLREFPRGG